MKTQFGILFSLIGLAATQSFGPTESLQAIGPTATVIESSSQLSFAARIDTGAATTSIHCEAMEIDGADEDPAANVGKPIRFLVKNKKGQSNWVESVIAEATTVRTSEQAAERYKVWITLRCDGIEKKVLVTLNDRSQMRYPVLIGRNFLRNDFVVDVARGIE